MEQVFSYGSANSEKLRHSFNEFSVIQINNIFPDQFCKEVVDHIEDNESKIIEQYKNDKRGLVVEEVNKARYIKYFDKPLTYNFNLFKGFISSKILKLSSDLLGEEVYLNAFELHSRYAHASEIPAHQDNAYFGLKSAKSITFYISLNEQYGNKGGLIYYKIPISTTMEHSASEKPGFSLTIKNKSDYEKLDLFNPQLGAGDCTIHHSTSIHFAKQVPRNAGRVLVVRLSFHAIMDSVKDGHSEWYRKMVELNRNKLHKSSF
ncbi:hypothetical protein [Prochlorococcus sp. MIT 1341]|uniref:hypothetical protein n=1 Tax=Prochlorococcus sp. MIT 1341 TaxID=3096221 RepID=UPI002A7513C3|nr:hypothetical protein [Prochlorococcus sp. MIT 1341]